MPTHARALSHFPVLHVRAHRVDSPRNFMSGNSWIFDAWPKAFFREHIAVADATSFYLDANFSIARLRNVSLDYFERTFAFCHLHSLHARHVSVLQEKLRVGLKNRLASRRS
jgi:hypothetical protein